jgi:hypothetical protein
MANEVTFSREQVSELTPFEPCSVKIPDNGFAFTLSVLIEKIGDRYDLTDDMIYLRNGAELSLTTVLEAEDHIFGKQGIKSRG